VLFYIAIAGSYPLLKSLFEKILNTKICFFVKLFYCIFLLSMLYLTFKGVVMQFIPSEQYLYPVLLFGGSIFFIIYDLALTKLIIFYMQRIRVKFKHM